MPRSRSCSRSRKRHRLDNDALGSGNNSGEERAAESSDEQPDDLEDCCTICLQPMSDRTVIPTCSHEFCFECLLLWTDQSRRCPLCSQNIGEYLIHSIRSRYDYRKHYLPPLRTSPAATPSQNDTLMQNTRQRTRRRGQDRVWGRRERGATHELDKLERSISKRRWIYEHNQYAKHVASNAYTKYRPYPTPAQFAASQDLISRTTTFLRRELQVWHGLDVEFLTTLIISLMKSIDIRSESAVKLISEFLDMDEPGCNRRNAEHFTHELYSYIRSPYKDLFVYDTVVQYDSVSGVSPPPDLPPSQRWHLSEQQLYSHHSEPQRRLRSSSRSPLRRHDQRSISPGVSEEEPESILADTNSSRVDRNDYKIRGDLSSGRSSTPTSRRTSSPVAKFTKGKEREPTRELSSKISKTCSSSNDANSNIQDEGEFIAESSERTLIPRPPRSQSLLETVRSHLAKNVCTEPRDFKLVPTGSRHMPDPTHTDSAPLARSSDPNAPSLLSRLSDPQAPSIVLPAANGDGGRPSSAALDSLEARARLLARLNREKRLHVYESSSSEHAPAN